VVYLVARNKGGKAFITLAEQETVCAPSVVSGAGLMCLAGQHGQALPFAPMVEGEQSAPAATRVCCVSAAGRILTFELAELKHQPKGGRGLQLLALDDQDRLVGAAAYTRSVRIEGVGRGGKLRDETLEIRSLNNALGARGRKGKDASFGFKANRVLRWV
jgi:topoisomerase IV subunit A